MLLHPELYNILPKKVELWSTNEVALWFQTHQIKISQNFQFDKNSFDGIAFLKVTPQYLRDKLEINSKIVIRKIIEWIENQSEDYDQYVLNQIQNRNQEQNCLMKQRISNDSQKLNSDEKLSIPFKPAHIPSQSILQWKPVKKWRNNKNRLTQANIESKNSHKEINQKTNNNSSQNIEEIEKNTNQQKNLSILQKLELKNYEQNIQPKKQEKKRKKNQKNQEILDERMKFVQSNYEIWQGTVVLQWNEKFFCLKNGGKIGRYTTNDVLICNDSVSRHHAEIILQDKQFYIKDIGSKFGTFLRFQKRIVTEGEFISFNDSLFEIIKVKLNKKCSNFDLKIRKICERQENLVFYGIKNIIVGSSPQGICLKDSGIQQKHARITLDQDGQIYIVAEEGNVFFRLQKDVFYKLGQSKTHFRFGLEDVFIKVCESYRPLPFPFVENRKQNQI